MLTCLQENYIESETQERTVYSFELASNNLDFYKIDP